MTLFGTSTHLHKYFLLLVVALFLLLLQTSDGRKSSISTKKSSSRRETATSTSPIPTSPSVAYNLSVITWNLAEKKPTDQDCLFLKEFRGDDFVVFGVQECENIKPRREEGHRSRAWRAIQKAALGKSYVCLAQHRMGGMQIAGNVITTPLLLPLVILMLSKEHIRLVEHTVDTQLPSNSNPYENPPLTSPKSILTLLTLTYCLVYCKKSLAGRVQGTQILDVACGVGNVLTNKGAVCVLLRIRGK